MKNTFAIILPGPCNMRCHFCDELQFDTELTPDVYMGKFFSVVNDLPDYVDTLYITGKEPTISRVLEPVLQFLRTSTRFKNVILKTNGTGLVKHLNYLPKAVTCANITRYSCSDGEN